MALNKLFTAEDASHVHKLLGLYALCHFARRYHAFFSGAVDMAFTHGTNPEWTLCTLAPHLALQLSGLRFTIPRRRISTGSRIWPEYRWHALVFTVRSLTLMALALLRAPQADSFLPPLIIVLGAMAAADAVTHWHARRGESSRTIRDLAAPPGTKYLMSAAQFHATTGCLLTRDRLSVQLVSLCVIQCAAFVMTLQRRGLITHRQDLILYSALLGLGLVVVLDDFGARGVLPVAFTVANAAALARLDLGFNKYVLWTAVALVLPSLCEHAAARAWLVLGPASVVGLVASSWRRGLSSSNRTCVSTPEQARQ